MLSLTRHLAASGARHGIRANSISPGLIAHAADRATCFEDPDAPDARDARARNPLGRLGEPEDVARVALFLASDDAAYVNATTSWSTAGESVIG